MRRFIVILLLLILIGTIIGLYYNRFEQKHDKNTLVIYGNVDVRQVDISFRIGGRVEKIFFEEGDFVPKGALMGTLNNQPYLDQMLQAEALAASTKASLNNSQILLSRRQELISDGSVSQEELDNALANKTVFEANLKNNEAALAVAATNLTFTEVYSPTDGIILTRIREPGTVVNPTQPIYTLSVISPVWIRAFVAEPFLGQIYPGMKAEIHTDTKNGKVYTGQVGFISPVAEFTPKTVETTQLRTDLVYRLRIYADNPDQGLRQGMPVTVKLPLNRSENYSE